MNRRSRRFLPEERERIVELKLQRVPVRTIAAELDTTNQTVQNIWNKYLKERATNRRKDLDIALEDTIARHEQNAIDARRGYQKATHEGDLRAATGFLNSERAALTELSKLGAQRDSEPAYQAAIAAEVMKSTTPLIEAIDLALITAGIQATTAKEIKQHIAQTLREMATQQPKEITQNEQHKQITA